MAEQFSAIFWDFQNVRYLTEVLEFRKKLRGAVPIARVYMDKDMLDGIVRPIYNSGFSIIVVPQGIKNIADEQIIIDITELNSRYPEISNYYIISGDGDFSSIIRHLKSYGKKVEVVANPINTSKTLIEEAHDFTSITQSTSSQKPQNGTVMDLNRALHLFDRGFVMAARKKVQPSLISLNMRKTDPSFTGPKSVKKNGKHLSQFKDLVVEAVKSGNYKINPDGTLTRTDGKITVGEVVELLKEIFDMSKEKKVNFQYLVTELKKRDPRYTGAKSVLNLDGKPFSKFSQIIDHLVQQTEYVVMDMQYIVKDTRPSPSMPIFERLSGDDWKLIFHTLRETLEGEEDTYLLSSINIRKRIIHLRNSEMFSTHVSNREVNSIIHKLVEEEVILQGEKDGYTIWLIPEDYEDRAREFIHELLPHIEVSEGAESDLKEKIINSTLAREDSSSDVSPAQEKAIMVDEGQNSVANHEETTVEDKYVGAEDDDKAVQVDGYSMNDVDNHYEVIGSQVNIEGIDMHLVEEEPDMEKDHTTEGGEIAKEISEDIIDDETIYASTDDDYDDFDFDDEFGY